MRNNQPVTDREVQLRDDIMIVSTTDLKGQITYANKDFLEVSGFTMDELIGQPHNIVRHPDMPADAFEDLWRTLKAGRPWTGFVKNRTKSGDYYWVEANATPIWQGSQVIGYMSLRRKPTRSAVAAHEAAYRLFREGRARGLTIRNGQAVSTGLVGRTRRIFADMSLAKKMMLACAAALVLVMGGLDIVLGNYMAGSLEQEGLQGLSDKLQSIRAMVEVRAKGLSKEAARLNSIFAGYYGENFALGGESEGLPLLKNGATVLNQRSVEVDRFTAVTGAVATVFARKGDELLRVTTSVKKENGERAVGTPLAHEHPAYARLLAGEQYLGRANLFGKDYYTSYTPIKGNDGKVIGATFIGLDISGEISELKAQIRAVKAGTSGYYYVIDASPGKDAGTLIVHPAKEGENILASKDADGREFIKEMLAKKQGTIRYPWLNKELGDSAARLKVVVYESYGEWNWLIGGGTYLDEFESLARNLQKLLAAASLAIVLLLVALIYGLIQRVVNRPLKTVLETFRTISGGDYTKRISIAANDELGQVFQGLQAMQTRMGYEVAESKRRADETLRIKIALDNVSTGVMIADPGRTIIYANKSVQRILKGAEADIRKQLPNFSAEQMVGVNIDTFHKNPAHQAQLLATFTSTYTANLEIGGRFLRVVASPVINEQGERLGAVAEWLDRTAEVNVEQEVAQIVEAAKNGDFEQRLSLAGKEGFIRQLAEGLNQLSEVTSSGLSDVARVLKSVAQGDLTQTIEADYSGIFGQLKEDTNSTVARLMEVLGQIREASEAINTASQEIAAGNQDLSSRTEEQASSLEETSSSMEELNTTVKQNAENAKQANELAKTSNAVATRGGEMVKRVVATMSDIQTSSKKIVDIIGVIDSIAFQTNILALNAAVEAARAGEQGRGFAVVATEVRNLAQRSATAAKEIKTLIAESVDKVEGGAKLVREAGDTMDDVVTSFQKVANLVTDISNASREQSSGIEQVTQAVSQMDEVTQQNAALVEEAAAAAESLEEQARGLVQAVGLFKLSGEEPARGGRQVAAALRSISRAKLTGGSGTLQGLDFDGALKAHLAWKEKLRLHLTGNGEPLDAKVIECDDKCALGQWIHGAGRQLAGDGTFVKLRSSHASFHQCAAKVLRHHQSGDDRMAYRLLGGDFSHLTSEVVSNLRALRERHGDSAPVPRISAVRPALGSSSEEQWEEF